MSDQEVVNEVNELLDELTQDFGYEERLPGDVDVYMMMQTTGKSDTRCRDILNKKVKSGELVSKRVRGDHGMPIMVWRKKSSQV